MRVRDHMKPKDLHIVIDASAESMQCYNAKGEKLWGIEAHTYGQHPDWRKRYGDTPRGVYEVGVIYDTKGEAAYGDWCIDLIDLEGQERDNGRDGISIHGGGSASPRPFAEKQGWYATHGCVRVQNGDMRKYVYPALKAAKDVGARIFVTVRD